MQRQLEGSLRTLNVLHGLPASGILREPLTFRAAAESLRSYRVRDPLRLGRHGHGHGHGTAGRGGGALAERRRSALGPRQRFPACGPTRTGTRRPSLMERCCRGGRDRGLKTVTTTIQHRTDPLEEPWAAHPALAWRGSTRLGWHLLPSDPGEADSWNEAGTQR